MVAQLGELEQSFEGYRLLRGLEAVIVKGDEEEYKENTGRNENEIEDDGSDDSGENGERGDE